MYTKESLNVANIYQLRRILRELGGTPGTKNSSMLLEEIIKIQNGEISPQRSNRGRKAKNAEINTGYSIKEEEFVQEEDFSEIEVCDTVSFYNADVKGILKTVGLKEGELVRLQAEKPVKRVFISKEMINRFSLKQGDEICGNAEVKDGKAYLYNVDKVNGKELSFPLERLNFDELPTFYPNQKISLYDGNNAFLKGIDLFCPIGKGQRCVVSCPQRADYSYFLLQIVKSLNKNYPNTKVVVLLAGERLEEISEYLQEVKGEVYYTTFDQSSQEIIAMVEICIDRAKRLAEEGNDVVLIVNSLMRIFLAYDKTENLSLKPSSDKVNFFNGVKNVLSVAKNVKEGVSLTLIAVSELLSGDNFTAYLDKSIEMIANSKIVLKEGFSKYDTLSKIDWNNSYTQRDRDLMSKEEYEKVCQLKKLNPLKGIVFKEEDVL